MTARFIVGDVFDVIAGLPAGSVDLVLTSPPFLALRSYLPDDHPDKAKEIGSEATPADFIDTLLRLTAEWGRVLAPHGSIAVELGDTYAGSGGAGGDYNADGLRAGQPVFSARQHGAHARTDHLGGAGWPLPKSLCGIPTLYAWSLAYGRNLLTGQPSPAGMWRIRNVKPWIRSNPPVGALGDKERPATSYVIVATRARDRYFDLDSARTGPSGYERTNGAARATAPGQKPKGCADTVNAAGAPPRDWWHHVDSVLDGCLDDMARKPKPRDRTHEGAQRYTPGGQPPRQTLRTEAPPGARGVHLRRALERAGILQTLEALDVSPTGFAGAHFAVWPPELVRLLVDEMCPRKVCTVCGEPSRRVVRVDGYTDHKGVLHETGEKWASGIADGKGAHSNKPGSRTTTTTTTGWTSCGHDAWRPGLVLDPFGGSGTTGAVCTGMGRDCVLIDIDERSVDLARQRVGMFLDIDTKEAT